MNGSKHRHLHPLVGTTTTLDAIELGSASSLASRLTGRTSNEYVVAIRNPVIRVLKIRFWRPLGVATVVVVKSVRARPDASSLSSSVICKNTYIELATIFYMIGVIRTGDPGNPDDRFKRFIVIKMK